MLRSVAYGFLLVTALAFSCHGEESHQADNQPTPRKAEAGKPKYSKSNPPTPEIMLQMLKKRRVSMELNDAPVVEAITFLQVLAKTNLIVDPMIAKRRKDTKVTLRVKDMPFPDALNQVCKQAGLVWDFRNAAVFVALPEKQ